MTEYDVIDVVARHMTAAEPSADFRARVVAQLPDRRPATRRWMVVPACAAAALAIGIVVVSNRPQLIPSTLPVAASVAVVRSEPATAGAVTRIENALQTTSVRRRSATLQVLPPEESQADRDWLNRAVPPLLPADPIVLGAIQPSAISIAPITVNPIVPDLPPATEPKLTGRN